MTRRTGFQLALVCLVLVLTPILVACGATATPTAVPATAAPTVAPTALPPTATKSPPTAVPPTATAKPAGPAVGGTLTYAILQEPDSLDPMKAIMNVSAFAMWLNAGTLITVDPTGKVVPYLAESWKVSTDGLTWDFVIKKGIKFHDGTPCTAKDFAYTFNLAKNPATKAAVAGSYLAAMASATAVDDYTFRVKLLAPFAPFLLNLVGAYLQPLSQAAYEKGGVGYGHAPVSTGPFMVKQWVTGDRIVLERDPDYNWGPAFAHVGPAYIQQIVVRVIPDQTTIVAGLEAGEIDSVWMSIDSKDVPRVRNTGKYQIFDVLNPGMNPALYFNVNRAPFDDVKVRQAFNYAVDKENVIKVVVNGDAIPQYGPLSPDMFGYSKIAEQVGYKFDLAKAKALMKDAGYVAGADGMLSKDGKPLKVTMLCTSTALPQVLQQQYKALGVDVVLSSLEANARMAQMVKGDFDFSTGGYVALDADQLWYAFDSKAVGSTNFAGVKDPELDKAIDGQRAAMDPAARQQLIDTAVKMIIEKAYCAPLYVAKLYQPLSNRVKGAVWSNSMHALFLNDAYIEAK
jgi:peptide/nickel transport system substrate-binding protein